MVAAIVGAVAVVTMSTVVFGAERTVRSLAGEGWTFDGKPVRVPHSWCAGQPECGFERRVGVYRRTLPDPTPGRRQFLRFEGVSIKAKVRVNGHEVGRHAGPVTPFTFEITSALNSSGNTLEVEADNREDRNVLPISGDFGVMGGIYRDCWLIESPCDAVFDGGFFADEIAPPPSRTNVQFRADGLYIDGRRTVLRGVNYHQDGPNGWVLDPGQEERDLRLIKQMGANAVRTCHYPRSAHFYDLCDKLGLYVWTELPLVWEVNPTKEYRANALATAREMVLAHRHHPCIIAWGVYNELNWPRFYSWVGKVEPTPAAAENEVVAAAAQLIRELDPTRPTTGASNNRDARELNALTDQVGFNTYPGWYGGRASMLGEWVAEFCRRNNRRVIAISEYGAGGCIDQHRNPHPRNFHPEPTGKFHPEDYQARVHEDGLRSINATTNLLWGAFVWQMFDTYSTLFAEGSRDGINDKGLVTRDRRTCKDAYYFYKANWNPEPMLHLCGKRMTVTDKSAIDVFGYCNCADLVTLHVNGAAVGQQRPDAVRTVKWTKVALKPGLNTIELCADNRRDAYDIFCDEKGAESKTYSQRLTRPLLPKAQKFPVQDAVLAQLDAADRAADAAWGRLGSRAEYEAYRTKQRQGFIDAMGGFDLPRTPLNAKVTEKIARDGYCIEKVIFESRPGVYVTGLLFLPDEAKFKPPYRAYIVPCGHTWEAKGSPGYQRGGVMGALAGFAALVYDPFAQGERMQPPAGGCCDGHNRYGALAELLGTSTARQRIWDGMRALDYLESRADIRKDGFGCMGNSGGGTETSLLEVADPRIVAACPSCWISTLRDTCRVCGPQDAEQLTFGQLAFGFNHASYVLAGGNAVRVHCNFEDFFPYSGTCETMAVVTNMAARCGLGARYGMTDVTGPHAWKESSRTSSVQWMRRWLAGDESTPPIDVVACRKLDEKYPKGYGESTKGLAFDCGLQVKQSLVTPQGQVSKLPGFRSLFEYLKDDLEAAEAARPKRTREELAKVVAARAGIRPLDAIAHTVREVARETLSNGVTVVSEVFTFADGIPVPAVTFIPAGAAKGAVLVTDDRHRGIHPNRVRDEMHAGRAIMVVDLAATGETGRMKHKFYNMKNADEETAMMLYVLGKSLVGVRAEETLVLADHLKHRTGHPAEVVASGRTVISSAHAFAVRPDLFVRVLPFHSPQSWTSSVRTSAVVPFANVVHGALKDYDWPELLVIPNATGCGVTETSIQDQE